MVERDDGRIVSRLNYGGHSPMPGGGAGLETKPRAVRVSHPVPHALRRAAEHAGDPNVTAILEFEQHQADLHLGQSGQATDPLKPFVGLRPY